MTREGTRHRGRRKPSVAAQLPWRQPVNRWRPLDVLSADHVEAIHGASLRVLEQIGVRFASPRAQDFLVRGGARVDRATGRVHFERDLVAASVARGPGSFTVRGRHPGRDVVIGDGHLTFASVAGPAHATDNERGRRPGSFADLGDALRLIHAVNAVHVLGGAPIAPLDLPPATRHLDTLHAFLTLTDRVFTVWPRGRGAAGDALDLLGIALGMERAALAAEPRALVGINADSPLGFDGPALDGMIDLALAGQAVVVTPFILAGGTAPASLAGALVQQNAEALAGITLVQLVRPGTPVVYGGFTTGVDMRSAAPAFGTPETAKAALAAGQLARRYGLPYRASAFTSAKAVDAQAAYESQMALWGAMLGGAHLVQHAAGWLDGGATFGFEKLILDVEMLQMLAETLKPLDTNEDELGLAAMREVGPGGHFFGAAHTLARYETAFYAPLLSDWRNFEAWREDGARDATQRAHRLYKELLRDFEAPPLEASTREELDD
ncbi:MAG: trimethylamine methyltransferase family protein, partial [Alphaproteobacteria bacterium]